MLLIKRTKVHKTKEGKEFKKVHFYVKEHVGEKEVEFEIEPVVFKDKKGNYNRYNLQLAHLCATGEFSFDD